MNSESELPSVGEILGTVSELLTGAAIGALVFPGFLLCVPGIFLLLAIVAIPIVAVALLLLALAVAGSLAASPYLLVRRFVRARRAADARGLVASAQPPYMASRIGRGAARERLLSAGGRGNL
jgi:hypothetical protein